MTTADDDLTERVREALRTVIDPELGFNIVDIGLIYCVTIEEGGLARISMTTTTRGCPATNYLKSGAGEAAYSVDGVSSVDVQLTYDPPWSTDMMSPVAKKFFGMG